MIIKKVYNNISLIFSLLILNGCSLEHNILIDMKNNEYIVDYTQLRDLDLIPFLYPEDLNDWMMIDSSEVELHYNRSFNYKDPSLSLFTINSMNKINSTIDDSMYALIRQKEIILKEPYDISVNDFLILKSYQFEGIFKGRRVKNNYDKLINYYSGFMDDAKSVIDGEEVSKKNDDGINPIFNQLIDFLYLESVAHIEWNQRNIYLNGLSGWRQNREITNLINENKIGLNAEQLSKILDASEHYLYEVVDNAYKNEIKNIWTNLKLEIYGTLFLLFNDFYIKMNIPGYNMYHNADSVDANTLIWDVDLDKFINDDYTIFVRSRIVNKTKSGLLFVVLLILSVLFIKKRYSKS